MVIAAPISPFDSIQYKIKRLFKGIYRCINTIHSQTNKSHKDFYDMFVGDLGQFIHK